MPGIPNYPKDMGTEWMNLKRQVKDAWTSSNSRTPYQKLAAGALAVSSSLRILAGAFLEFVYSNGITGMMLGRHYWGSDPVDGLFLKREDGSLALWIFTRLSDGFGYTAIFDQQQNVLFSDDGFAGKGVARPWIPMTFANTGELTAPPAARITGGTTDVAVSTSQFNAQHPWVHFAGYCYVAVGGSTMEVKFKNPETGVTLHAVTVGVGFFSGDFNLGSWDFGVDYIMDVTIRRASGSGNVGVTLLGVYGRQTP